MQEIIKKKPFKENCDTGFKSTILIKLLTCVLCVLQDFVFPEDAAFPIGGADKIHTHFVLEMHYDNPNLIPGKYLKSCAK